MEKPQLEMFAKHRGLPSSIRNSFLARPLRKASRSFFFPVNLLTWSVRAALSVFSRLTSLLAIPRAAFRLALSCSSLVTEANFSSASLIFLASSRSFFCWASLTLPASYSKIRFWNKQGEKQSSGSHQTYLRSPPLPSSASPEPASSSARVECACFPAQSSEPQDHKSSAKNQSTKCQI